MDRYRIASFLRRDGMLMRYGEDVELTGYSYFYDKLLEWMTNQINTQARYGTSGANHSVSKRGRLSKASHYQYWCDSLYPFW